MKGDFSRIPFDPTKHYAGVLHQQGRVWLDSDWNEDVAERLALHQQEIRDMVGPSGVSSSSGFQILASADARPDNFQISNGRGYVDGILCQIDGNTSYLTQPDFPDAPRINVPGDGSTLTALVYLEVWQRLITYLEDDSVREIALGGPDTSVRLKTVTQVRVVAIPNGIIKCSDAAVFLPAAANGQLTTLQPATAPAFSACQLPDSANFTGRENSLFRVEVHDGGDVAGGAAGFAFTAPLAADAAVGATSVTLAQPLTSDQAGAANRSGMITVFDSSGLSERIPVAGIDGTAKIITLAKPLANAYSSANKAGISAGIARFKWSRDNASSAVSVTDVKPDRVSITLGSLGRDLATAFRQGDLVELTDDASDLGPARGHLTFLKSDPDPDLLTVQLTDPLPATFLLNGEASNRHLVMRRWDGLGDAASIFDLALTPGLNLGDGVRLQFSGSDLRAGDFWQFAVRTADGSVQALNNSKPNGIQRHRCPLAIVTWGPPPPTTPPSTPPAGVAFTNVQDCRRVFPSLVDYPQAEKGFHINSIFVVNSANVQTALGNDTDVHLDVFNGLDILCDVAPDPGSISRPTCNLSTEIPVISASPGAVYYFPVNLAGQLSVDTTKMLISWRALPQTQAILADMITNSPNERGLLARLTLTGRFIWALNNPSLFLDGEAFGQVPVPATNTPNTALQLPSGNGRRGTDFQMWFWFVAAPAFAQAITAAPAQIHIGESALCTVTLSSSAPAGGAPATVSASGTPVTVPATVAVPAGATTFTFTVASGKTAGAVSISASFQNVNAPPTTTITILPLPLLAGPISISPVSILVGGAASGSVTLNAPAPAAGAMITLLSSNAAVASLPAASVVVAPGTTSASFSIHGASVGSATITATVKWPDGSGSNASGSISVRAAKSGVKDAQKETKDVRDHNKVDIVDTHKQILENVRIQQASAHIDIANGSTVSSGTARSFIRPDERPLVGEQVLQASRPEQP